MNAKDLKLIAAAAADARAARARGTPTTSRATRSSARPSSQGRDLVRWKYQRYMHDYLGCVKAVDESVGRLLKFLDDEGLADNTIVVYASDQGFYLGEHGWFDKRWIFEESLRTPLLVRWPGVTQAGQRQRRPRLEPRLRRDVSRRRRRAGPRRDAGPQPACRCSQGETPADWRKASTTTTTSIPTPHHVRPHYGVVTDRYKLVHFYAPDVDYWELFDLRERSARAAQRLRPAGLRRDAQRQLEAELARLRSELKVPEHDPPEASGRARRQPRAKGKTVTTERRLEVIAANSNPARGRLADWRRLPPACCCCVAALAGRRPARSRPNILWITSEDHGPHMGCYGDTLRHDAQRRSRWPPRA